MEGKGQEAVEPGSVASNVSQEERKAIWYALRYAGYRVDLLTEEDCIDGLLKNYAVLYVCGQNLERAAARAVRDWAKAGGTVFATAGAARKDEFDAPLTDVDDVLGRGKQIACERYRGPLRARIELIHLKRLDELKLSGGQTLAVYGSREKFAVGKKCKCWRRTRTARRRWWPASSAKDGVGTLACCRVKRGRRRRYRSCQRAKAAATPARRWPNGSTTIPLQPA